MIFFTKSPIETIPTTLLFSTTDKCLICGAILKFKSTLGCFWVLGLHWRSCVCSFIAAILYSKSPAIAPMPVAQFLDYVPHARLFQDWRHLGHPCATWRFRWGYRNHDNCWDKGAFQRQFSVPVECKGRGASNRLTLPASWPMALAAGSCPSVHPRIQGKKQLQR